MLGSSLLISHSLSSSIIQLGFVCRFSGGVRVRVMGSTTNNLTVLNKCTSDDKKEEEKEKEKEKEEEVLVQYVVLRRDLIDTWPLGSVVTQGCHASVSAVWSYKDDLDNYTNNYCSPTNLNSMHKVTLEVKGETQIKNLSEKLTANAISHKLWIEQPENIPTCLATKPYPKSMVSSFFRKLKLCK